MCVGKIQKIGIYVQIGEKSLAIFSFGCYTTRIDILKNTEEKRSDDVEVSVLWLHGE